jgi:hypothetical protein
VGNNQINALGKLMLEDENAFRVGLDNSAVDVAVHGRELAVRHKHTYLLSAERHLRAGYRVASSIHHPA